MIIQLFMSWRSPKHTPRCYGARRGPPLGTLSALPCCFDLEVPPEWTAQLQPSFFFRVFSFYPLWDWLSVTPQSFFHSSFSLSYFFCGKAMRRSGCDICLSPWL